MDPDKVERIEQAIRHDGRYPPEAYEFLQRGLEYTARAIHGESSEEKPRHISGQQFCLGLRALARESWGPLAKEVLNRWNVRCTRDFGEMVFLLIELGLMGRQPSDDVTDFDGVYDFDEAFGSYEISLETEDE